jgi:hypothetical protein
MTTTLNKLIQDFEKEFDKKFFEEEPNNDSYVLKTNTGNGPFADRHTNTNDIKNFLYNAIQEGYELGIKDVEKLEYMKEEKFSKQKLPYLQIMVNNEVIIRNDLRERIKLQLQSLLKGETNEHR